MTNVIGSFKTLLLTTTQRNVDIADRSVTSVRTFKLRLASTVAVIIFRIFPVAITVRVN